MDQEVSFGAWVSERRKALGLSRAELARRSACAAVTLRKIEEDARRPSPELAALLAEQLAIPAVDRATFVSAARGKLPVSRLAAPAPDPTPAPAAVTPRVASIPPLPHALIGREREQAEVIALLQRPATRLLTVTGPGGAGKTSLALQAASALALVLPDDVWFVDLSPVSDVARVALAIAQAIGLPESAQSDATKLATLWLRLGRWLSTRHALLVLDNLEQVADIAPQLAELLHTAPGIQVLATSRLALRLSQEHEYPIAPLPLPHAAATAAEMGASPAVRLFVERAQAVRPAFALNAHDVGYVAMICRRLDGLPLAIELAAARVRLFTPQELAAHLAHDNGLNLLSRGARDLPARQQTIRSTLEWSYNLLEPEQQVLLARLSVFVGGWTLSLAEAVCGGDGDVLNGLGLLVEHSLVQQQADGNGGMQFRLLETVRAFARERLAATGTTMEVRDRHLVAYVELAEEAEPRTRSDEQLEWLTRLDGAYDNLRAALVWSLDESPNEMERRILGLRLAGSLWYYWYIRGRFQEASRWLDHATTNDERLPVSLRAHMLLSHWTMLSDAGGQTEPYSFGVRGQGLAERAQDGLLLARWLALSGSPHNAHCAKALARRIQEPWWRAWLGFWLMTNVGGSQSSISTREQRQALLAEVRMTGDGALLGRVLSHLAYEYLTEGNFSVAQQLAEEELRLAHQLNFTFEIASALFVLTRVQQAQGNFTAARRDNETRYAVERLVDNPPGYTVTLLDSVRLAICQSDYEQAATLSTQVELSALRTWGTLDIYALWTHAWLALEQGRTVEAAGYVRRAIERCQEDVQDLDFDTRYSHLALRLGSTWLLGTIEAAEGRLEQAAAAFQSAANVLRAPRMDNYRANRGYLMLYLSGDAGTIALSGMGRIAGYYLDPPWARVWLNDQLTGLRDRAGLWESTFARAVWGRAYLGWGDYGAAASQLADNLRFYRKSGARRAIAETLEGLGMCAAQARPDHAMRLWGAASALRTRIGAPMWSVDRPIYERHVEWARVTLSSTASHSAWTAGEALTLEQVVAEALAQL